MTRLEVGCPHPKCDGVIPVSADTPAGVYRCLCWACQVVPTWDEGKPVVALQPRAGTA